MTTYTAPANNNFINLTVGGVLLDGYLAVGIISINTGTFIVVPTSWNISNGNIANIQLRSVTADGFSGSLSIVVLYKKIK